MKAPAISLAIAALCLLPSDARSATLIALWDFEGNYLTSNHNTDFDLSPGGGVLLVSSGRGMVAEFHGGTYPITDPGTLSHPDLDRLDTSATPDNASFSGGLSIMGWVNSRTATFPGMYVLIHDSSSFGSTEKMGFSLMVYSSIQFQLRDHSDGRQWATADGAPITSNRWYHVAATWDGAVSGGIALYLDGRPVPSTITALGSFQGLNGSDPLPIRVGATLGNSLQELAAFDGSLDHLALYSGVLTPAEVEADYLATRTALIKPTLSVRVSQVELCWDTVPSQLYQLQYRSVVTGDAWLPLGDWFLGNGSPFCTNDTVSLGAAQRFYQLITTNAP